MIGGKARLDPLSATSNPEIRRKTIVSRFGTKMSRALPSSSELAAGGGVEDIVCFRRDPPSISACDEKIVKAVIFLISSHLFCGNLLQNSHTAPIRSIRGIVFNLQDTLAESPMHSHLSDCSRMCPQLIQTPRQFSLIILVFLGVCGG